MQSPSTKDKDLAARLIGAIKPLMKSSQAEVMSATRASELTLTQMRMMIVLEHGGEDLPVNVLAERLELSMAATGRAVDAMVRSGLLSRQEDPVDRRVKRVGLTRSGRQTIARIEQARRKTIEQFVARLSEDEHTALAAAVATLGALTAAHVPRPGSSHGGSAGTPSPCGKTK
jgi:DNA-binding MarR family transcriptional regulator